jgi:hypothetical protein
MALILKSVRHVTAKICAGLTSHMIEKGQLPDGGEGPFQSTIAQMSDNERTGPAADDELSLPKGILGFNSVIYAKWDVDRDHFRKKLDNCLFIQRIHN